MTNREIIKERFLKYYWVEFESYPITGNKCDCCDGKAYNLIQARNSPYGISIYTICRLCYFNIQRVVSIHQCDSLFYKEHLK